MYDCKRPRSKTLPWWYAGAMSTANQRTMTYRCFRKTPNKRAGRSHNFGHETDHVCRGVLLTLPPPLLFWTLLLTCTDIQSPSKENPQQIMVEEKKDDDVVQPLFRGVRGGGDPRSGHSGSSSYYTELVEEVRTGSSSSSSNHRDGPQLRKDAALGFLLRYETMVRQQEAEEQATLTYLRPCLERLNELAGVSSREVVSLHQAVRFVDLKKALEALDALEAQHPQEPREFLTVDGQLMMVLRLLTKGVTNSTTTTLTWAEFLQCYKVCVSGMLTLQHLPTASTNSHPSTSTKELRARTRDRTISMLALFDPSSTELLTSSPSSSPSNSPPTSPIGEELPTRRKEGEWHIAPRLLRFNDSIHQLLSRPSGLMAALALSVVLLLLLWNSTIFRTEPVHRSIPKVTPYRHAYNASPLFPTSAALSASHTFRADTSCASPRVTRTSSAISTSRSASARVGGRCATTDKPTSLDGHDLSRDARSSSLHNPNTGVTLWQHAAGGAVALPLVRQFLWPTSTTTTTTGVVVSIASRWSTASMVQVASWGAAGVLLASLAAHLLSWLGRWWLAPPPRRATTTTSTATAPQAGRC